MTPFLLLISTYVVVFALGAQSLFVNNGRYVLAFCNSFVIGICNLALFKLTPEATGWQIASFLIGGPLGIVSVMWLFRHLHRRPG